MDEQVLIGDLDKADVLAALYNVAIAIGHGRVAFDPVQMYAPDARTILDRQKHAGFDYLKGRRLKVDLDGDSFDPTEYDRVYGFGMASKVVDYVCRVQHEL